MIRMANTMSTNREKLLSAAMAAREKAYAPYSNFHVGSALLSGSGRIYSGCNVENASFGLTICAERNAIFQMVAAGDKEISELLVIGESEEFLPPCGACRQVIAEFAQPKTKIYMGNLHGQLRETSVAELIPFIFFLKKTP